MTSQSKSTISSLSGFIIEAHDVPLSSKHGKHFPAVVYLKTGFKHYADKARIIVNEDGSVKTAYPFSSAYPF